ncbi:MAG: sensor histidine kinase, partial [Sphingobacteriales bacterium]
YRLFGYHQKGDIISWDLLGKDLNSHLDSDELQKAKDDWVKIINEADTYLREVDITTKDGYKRRVETFGKVFRDDQGIAYKIIGTSRDITKLREYEQELEIKVEELNRSNKDLEEFAYIASHDLHEPLRKLSTFGQRLSTCAHDELSPLSSDYLQRMLKATDNMRNLIDNLLEFSRVTRGASTFVKTDLNKIFEEVVHEQELKIEETDAIIQLCDMPTLEVVPSQIKQLFNNLLNNALKFISSTNRPQVKFTCSLLIPEERNHFKLKYNRE